MWFVGMGALKGVRDGAGARSVAPSSAWVGTADKQELPRARSREQALRGPAVRAPRRVGEEPDLPGSVAKADGAVRLPTGHEFCQY